MIKFLLIISLLISTHLYSQKLVFENEKEIKLTDSTGSIFLKIVSQDEPKGVEYGFFNLESLGVTYVTRDSGTIIINNLNPGKYPEKIRAVGLTDIYDTIIVDKNNLTDLTVYIPSEEEVYEQKADEDIKKGNITILLGGFLVFCTSFEEVNHIASKYGFQYQKMGCGFSAGKKYNKKMYKYLSDLNGDNWKEEFEKELDEYCEENNE